MTWIFIAFLSILGLVWYYLGLLVLFGVLVFLLGLFLILVAGVGVLDDDYDNARGSVSEDVRVAGAFGLLCLVLGLLLPFLPDIAGAGLVSLLVFACLRFPTPPSLIEVRFRE